MTGGREVGKGEGGRKTGWEGVGREKREERRWREKRRRVVRETWLGRQVTRHTLYENRLVL